MFTGVRDAKDGDALRAEAGESVGMRLRRGGRVSAIPWAPTPNC
jgi:hypothetical protein